MDSQGSSAILVTTLTHSGVFEATGDMTGCAEQGNPLAVLNSILLDSTAHLRRDCVSIPGQIASRIELTRMISFAVAGCHLRPIHFVSGGQPVRLFPCPLHLQVHEQRSFRCQVCSVSR